MILTLHQQEMLLLQGWLQLQYNQPEKARVLFAALLAIVPEHIDGQRGELVALIQLKQGEAALKRCKAIIAQGHSEPQLWLCLSKALQLEGELSEAQAAYHHYLTLEDTHDGAN